MKIKNHSVIVLIGRYPPYYGGGAKQVDSVLRKAAQLSGDIGFTVRVLCTREQASSFIRHGNDDVKVVPVGCSEGALRGSLEALRHCFPDILRSKALLLAVTGYTSLVLAMVAWLARKKIVLRTSLNGYDDALSILARFRLGTGRVYLWLMDEVLCNSSMVADSYRDCGYGDKTYYIPNGVNTELYRPVDDTAKAGLRKELGIPDDAYVLAYSGAVSKRKNVLLLLKALRRLREMHENSFLIIAGPRGKERYPAFDQEYRTRVTSLVADLGLIDRVRFESYEGDQPAFYQAADVYVLASKAEGMPNSLLEAMACGLPAVVLDQYGNLGGLVRDGENGYRLQREDIEAFVDRIQKILSDRASLVAMSRASRKIIESEYTLARTAAEYLFHLVGWRGCSDRA